jgi:protein phosphatase
LKNVHYHISIGNATDVGKVREHNEDYMAHFNTPLGYCVVICDGMGGHAAGEVASQNAIDSIKHFLQNGKITQVNTTSSLRNAIEFANFKLRELVKEQPSLAGMGTTCVLALIKNAEMFVAHAGDSRLYLIRAKEIKQITKDHSIVQNLVDSGALSEEEAGQSDRKNEITKAIGIFEKVEPTVTEVPIPLLHNDKIVLCSDGLTVHINNQVINEIVNSNTDVQDAAMQLIEKANEGGGSDNVTIQVIDYTGKSSTNRKKRTLRKFLLVLFLLIIAGSAAFFIYKEIILSSKPPISNPKQVDPVKPDAPNK